MMCRIGLAGALLTLVAGCVGSPPSRGQGDASPVDAAADADDGRTAADDRPDVPAAAPDAGTPDRPAVDPLSDPNNCGAPGVRCWNGRGLLSPCVGGRCACYGGSVACGSPEQHTHCDHRSCGE